MAYLKATKVLNDNQLDYIPSVAGHFIFLNLGKTFESIHGRKMTFEDENELKKKLLCNGVYIVPGYAFHCHQPGFFRLTFSVLPEDLEDGLMIILGSLH
jgi:DNA-binding transcriptional MocR family regulator